MYQSMPHANCVNATARAEHSSSPHSGSGCVKSAPSGWVESGDTFRSQPQRSVLTSRVEPEPSSGTGPGRLRITSATSPGQIEPLMGTRTYDSKGDNIPISPDPVTNWKGNATQYSLLSRSSVGRSEIVKVDRGDAAFGFRAMTITDRRMPAGGLETQFRPLIGVHLGAYKLPIFIDGPNPQTEWPRW
jgi:hypothetical protein